MLAYFGLFALIIGLGVSILVAMTAKPVYVVSK